MSHREPPPQGALRLRDLNWDDDHHVWDIKLDQLRATHWTERANDEWESAEYAIRRIDGRWQYFEDEEKIEQRKQLLAETLHRRKQEPTHLYPPAVQADVLKDNMQIERQIRSAQATWVDFHPEMSEEMEEEWTRRQGQHRT
jgi:hypothetical protein